MARLGDERTDDKKRAEETIVRAGVRMGALITQVIAAIIILGMFAGMAYLVLVGSLAGEALILYAGVILGYLLHSIKDLL